MTSDLERNCEGIPQQSSAALGGSQSDEPRTDSVETSADDSNVGIRQILREVLRKSSRGAELVSQQTTNSQTTLTSGSCARSISCDDGVAKQPQHIKRRLQKSTSFGSPRIGGDVTEVRSIASTSSDEDNTDFTEDDRPGHPATPSTASQSHDDDDVKTEELDLSPKLVTDYVPEVKRGSATSSSAKQVARERAATDRKRGARSSDSDRREVTTDDEASRRPVTLFVQKNNSLTTVLFLDPEARLDERLVQSLVS